MKVLHTSDWHLGQRFHNNDREAEHRLALQWLLETIRREGVDLLVVAGDIFDISNPPNYARELYYRFLSDLRATGCRHAVFIGGNHDSPAMLNAPRELLRALDIHVVGHADADPAGQCLVLKDPRGRPEAVVAAVPFLRERDLLAGLPGEGVEARRSRLQEAMVEHFRRVAAHIEAHTPAAELPVIATGHLYATGAETSAKQDNIYLGNTENIRAEQFPDTFDYVALGHIHRPQAVGGREHIRYSGSLIPLSFSETLDEKSVILLRFEGKALNDLRELPLPTFRRLKTIEDLLVEVKKRLQNFSARHREELPPWVEVIVRSEAPLPGLDAELRDFCSELHLELLKIRTTFRHRALQTEGPVIDLSELEPLEVFRQRCGNLNEDPATMRELEACFRELLEGLE